jgi:hypothetical protein
MPLLKPSPIVRNATVLLVAGILSISVLASSRAQTQEPKPVLPATPVAEPGGDGVGTGSGWESTQWGVRVTWDPTVWSIGDEFTTEGYDGVQIIAPPSTMYLEVYEGFGGDAEACFADADREIQAREGFSEVVPLEDRPLPSAEDERGPARLYGLTATLPDGATYRGIEYIECRTVVPGEAVLEITWQAPVEAFNTDFPRVEALLAAIELPGDLAPATPEAPMATPIA